MSRECRKCGAPVPAGASFFCNRCGARLPAEGSPEPLICRKCGKTLTDLQSLFCDRCGTMIVPAVQPLPQVTPWKEKKACPQCGFENRGNSLFYCKKCGTSLEISESVTAQRGRSQEMQVRNRAVSGTPLQQKTVNRAAETRPMKPRRRTDAPQAGVPGSRRKVIIGIAAVILIIAAIAFTMMGNQGKPGAGPENSTDSGLFGVVSLGNPLDNALLSNQATPVVTDMPLDLENP